MEIGWRRFRKSPCFALFVVPATMQATDRNTARSGDERNPTVAPVVRIILDRLLPGHDHRRADRDGPVAKAAVHRPRPYPQRAGADSATLARRLRGLGRAQPPDV